MINHPQKDLFGTTIDVINDAYIVTLEGDIVHPLNTDRYFEEVLKYFFLIHDSYKALSDYYGTWIVRGDKYYKLSNDVLLDSSNAEKYLIEIQKAQLMSTNDEL